MQEEFYSEIESGTPSAGHDMSTMQRKRANNFMEKPEDGWQHDDRGIGAGLGVLYDVLKGNCENGTIAGETFIW